MHAQRPKIPGPILADTLNSPMYPLLLACMRRAQAFDSPASHPSILHYCDTEAPETRIRQCAVSLETMLQDPHHRTFEAIPADYA